MIGDIGRKGSHNTSVKIAARSTPGGTGQPVIPGNLRLSPGSGDSMDVDGLPAVGGRGLVKLERGAGDNGIGWNCAQVKADQGTSGLLSG